MKFTGGFESLFLLGWKTGFGQRPLSSEALLELESSLPRGLTTIPDKVMLAITGMTQLLAADVDFVTRLLNMFA